MAVVDMGRRQRVSGVCYAQNNARYVVNTGCTVSKGFDLSLNLIECFCRETFANGVEDSSLFFTTLFCQNFRITQDILTAV
jgi:hypothetical protein